MRPQLSDDVLTAKDAEALAIAMREAVLIGKDVHPVEIERLCCFVIKGAENREAENAKQHAPVWDSADSEMFGS